MANISNDTLYIAYYKKSKTLKVSEIAKKYNASRGRVYYSTEYFEPSYEDNRYIRDQIMYGSILGDGYLQNVGDGKCFKYRESHSIAEKEYAIWKYLMLGDWTEGTIVCDKNLMPCGTKHSAVELYTSAKVSDEMEKWYGVSIDEAIDNLAIEGLIIYLLDDGWYSDHSIDGNYCIGSTILTEKQLNKIIDKFSIYGIDANLIGERKDISINSRNNILLFSYLYRMFKFTDLDIIYKKFGDTMSHISDKLNQS